MKSILSFLNTNALVIALLGVVGYQQTVLTELLWMSNVNNEDIVDTYNKLIGVEIHLEQIAVDVDDISNSVNTIKYHQISG